MEKMRSAYWLSYDLRVRDNYTLNSFCEKSDFGFFFYVPSKSDRRAGEFRKKIKNDSLESFQNQIFPHEIQVYQSLNELEEVLIHNRINSVFFTEGYSVEEKRDENEVKLICKKLKISVHSYSQQTLISLSDLPFSISEMPDVFTEFRKKVESVPIAPVTSKRELPQAIFITEKKSMTNLEAKAQERLDHYFFQSKRVETYKITRNGMIDFDDSTKLSIWLAQGLLSARDIFHELQRVKNQNESTYWVYFELLWRDYFKFLSLKYKHNFFKINGIQKRNVEFKKTDQKVLTKWKKGETGHDFIDANMIELKRTGWMSNRGRQNVASYLIHHLRQPWILGAEYFEEMLIDYDPESNWGNWLYLSGNGTDPRSRVFNPDKQALDYDPERKYIEKWLYLR